MSRHVTPMTSVRGMGSLPQMVETREGPAALKRLFDRVDLPLAVTTEPHRLIPLRDLVALFDHAARITGDPLFGLHVGTAMADGFGLWARYARSAPTLKECLGRAARALRFHQTGTRLVLTTDGDLARFSYHMPHGHPRARRQHLEHTLPALLQTFRTYAGESWQPRRVEVDYPVDRHLPDVEQALGVPVEPGLVALSVVFDETDLNLARGPDQVRGPPVTWLDLRTMVRQRPPRTAAGIVSELIQTRLLDGRVDIDGIAEKLAMGPRTLQRRLDREGHTYRGLLADAQMARARHLLVETEQPIIEIALSLGYSDPAHFARAFRRATALAPRRYRQTCRRDV